ncbi:hypothetical protein HMPREF9488_02596 [Coprobacillus cateniformis]|uniref:DNA repair protein RecN n=1 Tax=Coprobacillus cateniformis TaxID=100884 RepID=E7GCV4_9FIRM|nr:DNA repair protein RecN [Coprobacillus cateniformis]EFW04313.1 hypothetical protein HMPREF9488_02596 [Coprobacillus cateniformis]
MLKSLYISSFVIIDQTRIDFESGMSVLTGETGAGKSIIIDALGQLCGNRASVSLIKKNCSKAIIEGVFDATINEALEDICEQLHIEPDEQFVITKEILQSGKSNIKINYQNASNQALKLLMPLLIDIHSQFETQKLFEEKNHIILLDEFSSQELADLQKKYANLYTSYKELKTKLKKTLEEDMSDEQLDFLESQLDEIDKVEYTDDEVDELENELKMLQNFEKMNEDIQNFDRLMNSSKGALPLIKESLNALESVNEIEAFQKSYDNIYNQYYLLIDDYENVMETYREFQFDQYRFNEIQETLYIINRLKRKYGFTMERIKEYRNDIIEKIEKISHREEYIQDLQKQVSESKDAALLIANQMHHIRLKNANHFERLIQKEFKDLYLDKAILKVNFDRVELCKNGIDRIQFLVSINKGQDLSLLNESASGGEISRIMLAIKTIILAYSSIETIIFDEVDTGVSGKVASSIGDKMLQLAQNKQVICITHLPQVACLAEHHYCIEKMITDHETTTAVHLLSKNSRIEEIAKMLSGEKLTPEAIENAKKLLNV